MRDTLKFSLIGKITLVLSLSFVYLVTPMKAFANAEQRVTNNRGIIRVRTLPRRRSTYYRRITGVRTSPRRRRVRSNRYTGSSPKSLPPITSSRSSSPCGSSRQR